MNRREFIGAVAVAAASAVVGVGTPPKPKWHVFSNDEGELIAAETQEQAARYHDCFLGGDDEPREGWSQVPDSAQIPIYDEDKGITETMTAAQWASEYDHYDEPVQIATTYT